METMKAIACTKYGPPDVLKIVEYERPVPQDDEVLIKIHATSVTNSDIFIRGSQIPLRFRIPMRLMIGITRPRHDIIGEVLSGEVVQVGAKIRRFKVGDQVFGLTGFSLGAYADYKCMKEDDSKQGCIALKPDNISHEEATSAAYGGLLALQYLDKAGIRPNQKVLVYGASGTAGTIARAVREAPRCGRHRCLQRKECRVRDCAGSRSSRWTTQTSSRRPSWNGTTSCSTRSESEGHPRSRRRAGER